MQVITDVVTCIAERMHAFGEEGKLCSFQFSSRQRLNHHSVQVLDVLWPWILGQCYVYYTSCPAGVVKLREYSDRSDRSPSDSLKLILQKLCVHCQGQGSQVSSVAGFNKNIFYIHNETSKTE